MIKKYILWLFVLWLSFISFSFGGIVWTNYAEYEVDEVFYTFSSASYRNWQNIATYIDNQLNFHSSINWEDYNIFGYPDTWYWEYYNVLVWSAVSPWKFNLIQSYNSPKSAISTSLIRCDYSLGSPDLVSVDRCSNSTSVSIDDFVSIAESSSLSRIVFNSRVYQYLGLRLCYVFNSNDYAYCLLLPNNNWYGWTSFSSSSLSLVNTTSASSFVWSTNVQYVWLSPIVSSSNSNIDYTIYQDFTTSDDVLYFYQNYWGWDFDICYLWTNDMSVNYTWWFVRNSWYTIFDLYSYLNNWNVATVNNTYPLINSIVNNYKTYDERDLTSLDSRYTYQSFISPITLNYYWLNYNPFDNFPFAMYSYGAKLYKRYNYTLNNWEDVAVYCSAVLSSPDEFEDIINWTWVSQVIKDRINSISNSLIDIKYPVLTWQFWLGLWIDNNLTIESWFNTFFDRWSSNLSEWWNNIWSDWSSIVPDYIVLFLLLVVLFRILRK